MPTTIWVFCLRVGGKDEAWYYRMDHFDLWQTRGGLEWLRQQSAPRQKKES